MRQPIGNGSETGRNSGYREPQSLNLDDLLLKNPGLSMRNSPRKQVRLDISSKAIDGLSEHNGFRLE